MNWHRVIRLALALFAAQFTLGFFEGLLSGPESGISALLIGNAASLIVCSLIFGRYAARNAGKPFAHAWLSLLLQILTATLASMAFSPWMGEPLWLFVLVEWVVLVAALLIGTSLGIFLGRSSNDLADA